MIRYLSTGWTVVVISYMRCVREMVRRCESKESETMSERGREKGGRGSTIRSGVHGDIGGRRSLDLEGLTASYKQQQACNYTTAHS